MKKHYLAPESTTLFLNLENTVMQIISGDGASADLDIIDATNEEDWVY